MSKTIKLPPPEKVKIELGPEEFKMMYGFFFGFTRRGTGPIKEFNNIFAKLDKEAKQFYGAGYQSETATMEKQFPRVK